MTIEYVSEDSVGCLWFDKGKVHRDVFPRHTLKKNTEGTDLTIIMQGMGPPQEGQNA